jgi:hypothetical protein
MADRSCAGEQQTDRKNTSDAQSNFVQIYHSK